MVGLKKVGWKPVKLHFMSLNQAFICMRSRYVVTLRRHGLGDP